MARSITEFYGDGERRVLGGGGVVGLSCSREGAFEQTIERVRVMKRRGFIGTVVAAVDVGETG